ISSWRSVGASASSISRISYSVTFPESPSLGLDGPTWSRAARERTAPGVARSRGGQCSIGLMRRLAWLALALALLAWALRRRRPVVQDGEPGCRRPASRGDAGVPDETGAVRRLRRAREKDVRGRAARRAGARRAGRAARARAHPRAFARRAARGAGARGRRTA